MKRKKIIKRVILSVVAVVLVAAIGVGSWLYFSQSSREPVYVLPFNYVGMTEYWGDTMSSYGPVSTDRIQTVYLSSTQTVTEIVAHEGDHVRKGDVLMRFDTTLDDLALERARLGVEKLKLQLEEAEDRLREIRNMVPMYIPPEPDPTEPGDVNLGVQLTNPYQVVSESAYDGSAIEKAMICWLNSETGIDPSLFAALRDIAQELYNVNYLEEQTAPPTEPTQATEPSQATEPVSEGLAARTDTPLHVVFLSEESDPSDPSESSEPPASSEPTEPKPAETEPTEPKPTETEPTEPKPTETELTEPKPTETESTEPKPTETESTEPKPTETEPTEPKPTETEPTEPKPTETESTEPKPTETKPTEPKPTEPEPTEPALPTPPELDSIYVIFKVTDGNMSLGQTLIWQGVHISRSGGYTFQFFDASGIPDHSLADPNAVSNSGPQIQFNSGYTAAQIAQMRSDQEKTIKDLEFQIKMAEADYKIKQTEVSDGNVYASIDGAVVSLMDPEEAKLTGQPFMKVSGGGGFYVEGSVSELDRDKLVIGQAVTVSDWRSGSVITGVIQSIGEYPTDSYGYSGDSNPNSSYYPFTVFIDGTANLMEGSYVDIEFSAGEATGGIYLQNPFIREENGKSYVYVQGSEGLLEKRYVTTGKALWGSYTEILSGLTETDLIAFPYGKNVKDGVPAVEGDISDLYNY